MIKKGVYFFKKLLFFSLSNFSLERLRSFGISIPILRFIVFLGHRGNNPIIKSAEFLHDKKVNGYIQKKYADVFKKYTTM